MSEFKSQTLMCAAFLPHKEIDMIIKHKKIKGICFLRKKILKSKHLSINTLIAKEKRIRKVVAARFFVFETSVFKNYKFDTKDRLNEAFNNDIQKSKIKRFVKNHDDQIKTYKTLRKHYVGITHQFMINICDPRTYPVVYLAGLMESCNQWKVIDKNLTVSCVDRVFINTNFEMDDLEENDDTGLCRFEYVEIIARMAKRKYLESSICSTIGEAVEKILTEHIIPNTIAPMDGKEFRENQLWTLEVDDLFKDNMVAIKELYQNYATHRSAPGQPKSFGKEDALRLCEDLPLQERQVLIAYALSKQRLLDEMAEFDQYHSMKFHELFEFIARCATFLNTDHLPLTKKLEQILRNFLPKVDAQFIPSMRNDDVDSQSDEDDDLVDELMQEHMRSK